MICLALFAAFGCTGQSKAGKGKTQELTTMENQKEIYLAGGCFWGTEHFMKQIRGVEATQVGYANSTVADPDYRQVCSGRTGAAEAVKVVYDPAEVGLPLLLGLYFKTIDPTSLNKQGNDRGTQYRTGIYYTDLADREVIVRAVDELSKRYDRPLAIEVTFGQFLSGRRLSPGLSGQESRWILSYRSGSVRACPSGQSPAGR